MASRTPPSYSSIRSRTPLTEEARVLQEQLVRDMDRVVAELKNPEGKHVWVGGLPASGRSFIIDEELLGLDPAACVLSCVHNLDAVKSVMATKARIIVEHNL